MGFDASYILNNNLNVKVGETTKIINVDLAFSHKVVGDILVNPNIAGTVSTTSPLGTPWTVTGLTEFTSSQYDNVSNASSYTTSYSTSTAGNYAYCILKLAVKTMAQRTPALTNLETLTDLANRFINLNTKVVGYGSGSNGGVLAYGLGLYMYNVTTNSWVSVGTNSSSQFDSTSKINPIFNGSISDYINASSGLVYFAIRPSYPSDGTIPSTINLSYVKSVLTMLGIELAVGTQLMGSYSHSSIETTATTTEAVSLFNVENISVLSNDGNDDIQFNFDDRIGDTGTITLKAGETLTDFNVRCMNLFYKAKSGSQPFRAWGVR